MAGAEAMHALRLGLSSETRYSTSLRGATRVLVVAG